MIVGRFAPSPTGRMHAGNIFAALNAWLIAKSQNGEIVLRIEDLDKERSRPEYADAVMRDFESLGLTWDRGPYFQHDRNEAYEEAFDLMSSKGLIYPCFCTRSDLAMQSAPHMGDRRIYDRRCKSLSEDEISDLEKKRAEEGRSSSKRIEVPNVTVEFDDFYQGRTSQNLATECGDFLVKRADGAFAYQLAVVVDDARQGVNSVVRGYDLLSSTPQQMYLQSLLGYEFPQYAHFPLFCAADGRRLAKRNKSAAYDELLMAFGSPQAVLGHVAFVGGLQDFDVPATPEDLLEIFRAKRPDYKDRISIEYF